MEVHCARSDPNFLPWSILLDVPCGLLSQEGTSAQLFSAVY